MSRRGSGFDRVRAVYDRTADDYDRQIGAVDRLLLLDGRAWAARQASGITLEVGVGTGRNLRHYPAAATVLGLDASLRMLDVARARNIGARVVQGDAGRLPLATGSVDTVLSTLVYCALPEPAAAVAEMARVLRPGGRLVLLDHVASHHRLLRAAQWALEPVARGWQADSLVRNPAGDVALAGLRITLREVSRLGLVQRLVAVKSSSSQSVL